MYLLSLHCVDTSSVPALSSFLCVLSTCCAYARSFVVLTAPCVSTGSDVEEVEAEAEEVVRRREGRPLGEPGVPRRRTLTDAPL